MKKIILLIFLLNGHLVSAMEATSIGFYKSFIMAIDKLIEVRRDLRPIKFVSELCHMARKAHYKWYLDRMNRYGAVDSNRNWLLRSGVYNNSLVIVEVLLERGIDLEDKNEYGYTPLHTASLKGHIAMIKLLLENGAYIEAKDNHNHTPLHLAAFNGHLLAVKYLLTKGIDPMTVNHDGETARDLAITKNHQLVANLLPC